MIEIIAQAESKQGDIVISKVTPELGIPYYQCTVGDKTVNANIDAEGVMRWMMNMIHSQFYKISNLENTIVCWKRYVQNLTGK